MRYNIDNIINSDGINPKYRQTKMRINEILNRDYEGEIESLKKKIKKLKKQLKVSK